MVERRVHRRYTIWFPVTLDSGAGEVWAICRDASRRGILISSQAELVIGTAVAVRFRVAPGEREERTVRGRVVRKDGAMRQVSAWPHTFGIEFETEVPELEAQLAHHSTRPPPPNR